MRPNTVQRSIFSTAWAMRQFRSRLPGIARATQPGCSQSKPVASRMLSLSEICSGSRRTASATT